MCNLCSRWTSLVAKNVCIRQRCLFDSHITAFNIFLARAKPAIPIGLRWAQVRVHFPTSLELPTASKSPGEEIGKPASHTSTPRSARFCAIFSFSLTFKAAPGDCSPSRSVVSKIRSLSVLSLLPTALSSVNSLRRSPYAHVEANLKNGTLLSRAKAVCTPPTMQWCSDYAPSKYLSRFLPQAVDVFF